MRSLSYVQRAVLEFSGSLFPHALCLGDADNDSLNELVLGDASGKLHVYKNEQSKPWLTRSCSGMNFVIAVSAEGWFHLFDLTAKPEGPLDPLQGDDQKATYTQHLPANTKLALISDIDGDGLCELVLGYTDRVVRAFRWESPPDADLACGQLVALKKWLLEGQVDSLSVNPGTDGTPELMVSQPGCGYAVLLCTWKEEPSLGTEGTGAAETREVATRDVILHQTSLRIHNKNVSTHLIGSIKRGPNAGKKEAGLFALCTLDGTLKLMQGSDRLLQGSDQLLWSVQVDHQLFALEKLDITGNGEEEVVACAWDGQTYIIDHNRAVLRFQVEENVSAFCAGLYACRGGQNSPCLVYVGFNQKIYIYWAVTLERIESSNLLRVMEGNEEFSSLLSQLHVDTNDPSAVCEIIHQTMYFPNRGHRGHEHPANKPD
ncbi:KICSTOR complex protein ITFG2 isoform X2 [Xenopus laevis]|uniref:KICSTOR complex protein ITFG2 isoform X2 n=1 Tax=Xenopus laevis TaxID=8355 RepID=A0A8J0UPX8_XENLA|nr:KICSTOR complex protein ITFG2 isoform X2 [Xenopus laevis]